MKKDLSKLYNRLTPRERIRAALDASARDDLKEMAALMETCPRHTYEIQDVRFTRPMVFYNISALIFALSASDLMTKIRVLETFPTAGELMVVLLSASDKVSLKKLNKDAIEAMLSESEELRVLFAMHEEALTPVVAQLKGLYTGFERLCAKREMEAATLLKAFTGTWADSFFEVLSRYEDIPADAEQEEVLYQELKDKWPGLAA